MAEANLRTAGMLAERLRLVGLTALALGVVSVALAGLWPLSAEAGSAGGGAVKPFRPLPAVAGVSEAVLARFAGRPASSSSREK